MFMKNATRIYNQCLLDIMAEIKKNAYLGKPNVDSQFLIDRIDKCKLELGQLLKKDFETVLDEFLEDIV